MQFQGSQPKEIFQTLIEEENEILKSVKPQFKTLIKENGIRFANTSFLTFDQTLQEYPEYSKMNQIEKNLLHEYYLEKVKQKEL